MNLDKYLSILIKFLNKYLKILLYSFFLIILLFSLYFTYTDVYKTALFADKIEDSEIIAKKQKVNITLFKEMEEKINSKNDKSIEIIPNIFE